MFSASSGLPSSHSFFKRAARNSSTGTLVSLLPYNERSTSSGSPPSSGGTADGPSSPQSAADSFLSDAHRPRPAGSDFSVGFPCNHSSSSDSMSAIVSGTPVSLFPCRSRIRQADSVPIDFGSRSSLFPAATSSTSDVNSPIESGRSVSRLPAMAICFRLGSDPMSTGSDSSRFPWSHSPSSDSRSQSESGRCTSRLPDSCNFSSDASLPIPSGSTVRLFPARESSTRSGNSNTSPGTTSRSQSDRSSLPEPSAMPILTLMSGRRGATASDEDLARTWRLEKAGFVPIGARLRRSRARSRVCDVPRARSWPKARTEQVRAIALFPARLSLYGSLGELFQQLHRLLLLRPAQCATLIVQPVLSNAQRDAGDEDARSHSPHT
mmetsp:Transcript_12541/g.35767  ORF Transcript_12541/g.35767 Transcript_12541/m.35767 type:complete len:380 (+) Transcript_12541:1028-2167(+)